MTSLVCYVLIVDGILVQPTKEEAFNQEKASLEKRKDEVAFEDNLRRYVLANR